MQRFFLVFPVFVLAGALLSGCGGGGPVTPGTDRPSFIEGSLSTRDFVSSGRYYDIYVVEPTSSGRASVEMFSNQVDSFLYVYEREDDGDYIEIENNDDCGATFDSCVFFDVQPGDVYRIVTTSAETGERGDYDARFSANLGRPARVLPSSSLSSAQNGAKTDPNAIVLPVPAPKSKSGASG